MGSKAWLGDRTNPIERQTTCLGAPVAAPTSLSDENKRDARYQLLTALGITVDNGDSSFAEVTVKMRVKDESVEDLAAKVRATGPDPTITEV